MASTMFADIVTDLAARAGVSIRELGTVEGKGGLLGVWGTHAPDWAAPAVPLARQLRRWRHAASTGALAISLVVLVVDDVLILALVSALLIGHHYHEKCEPSTGITEYHAHIYYDPATSRGRAERVRERSRHNSRRPKSAAGTTSSVGPHPQSMYQIAFPRGCWRRSCRG